MQQNIISNFFRPINTDIQIPDSEYAKTDVCIVMADALARNTNHSLYIIDYHRKNFLYVSSNPLFLCGHSPEEVQQKGYAFYFEVVPSDEINRLMEINEAGFRFYYDQPIEKRLDLSIEYNFHIHTSEKHPHLIHHKLTPVLLSGKGDIWLALCTVSLSPEKNIGDVVISDHTCTDHYIYSFEGRRWRKQPELILSDREKEILQLSVKGLSNTEIGETLFIDANTVKFHKKKIFEKLHAENITEAVGIAANHISPLKTCGISGSSGAASGTYPSPPFPSSSENWWPTASSHAPISARCPHGWNTPSPHKAKASCPFSSL